MRTVADEVLPVINMETAGAVAVNAAREIFSGVVAASTIAQPMARVSEMMIETEMQMPKCDVYVNMRVARGDFSQSLVARLGYLLGFDEWQPLVILIWIEHKEKGKQL